MERFYEKIFNIFNLKNLFTFFIFPKTIYNYFNILGIRVTF